jgi:3-deoxy-manno-octulosonate cytidylyltransferase (CMP-KDO synthetase)
MKVVGVIPARYKSSRFEGKPLATILGKPMIIYVVELTSKALGKENTYVATDDNRIKECVESCGYNVIMTSDNCLTGTDRLWDFAKQVKADIYINIQGDEPVLNPEDITKIVQEKLRFPNFVVNGMCDLDNTEDPASVNIPKVLVNKDNMLIYISRLPIPGQKDKKQQNPIYKKQVCIYAFTYRELQLFGETNNKTPYERAEDIEILRFFDLNIPVKMVQTSSFSLAVDVPGDIDQVEKFLLFRRK